MKHLIDKMLQKKKTTQVQTEDTKMILLQYKNRMTFHQSTIHKMHSYFLFLRCKTLINKKKCL